MHVANQLHDYDKLKANTQDGNLNGPKLTFKPVLRTFKTN